jgi:hypothetical protein
LKGEISGCSQLWFFGNCIAQSDTQIANFVGKLLVALEIGYFKREGEQSGFLFFGSLCSWGLKMSNLLPCKEAMWFWWVQGQLKNRPDTVFWD